MSDFSYLLAPPEEDDFSTGSQSLLDNARSQIEAEDASIPTLLDDLNLGSDADDDTDGVLVSTTTTSSSSTESWVDLLEEFRTSARNGDSQVLSTIYQFVGILSRTGISGPRHLKSSNIKSRGMKKIGSGTQFTVFKDNLDVFGKPVGFVSNEGLVIKRVNVPLSIEEGGTFAQGTEYRKQLKSLELEVLALCSPAMRNHRNIVRMVAWGYDYPQPDTPVPVLFMESALAPLNDFLDPTEFSAVLSEGKWEGSDIKYHLALDIVAGVEAMHSLGVVHGDLKPENILVFREKSTEVPFCAKLSDFGVCVDLENSTHPLTVDDYVGTPAWLAPEVRARTVTGFKPEIMQRFDSYSLGLVLMSIFTKNGGPVSLDMDEEDPVDVYYLREEEDIPRFLTTAISASLRKYLAKDPWARELPNTELLSTSSVAYASWLSASQRSRSNQLYVGTMDPVYNKGPLFWYKLDPSVYTELERQYASFKADNSSSFPGDVCFGLSQAVIAQGHAYLDRMVDFLTDAVKQAYSPARAVYGQIIRAHGLEPQVDDATLDQWMLKAISEGYLFASPSPQLSMQRILSAEQQFRDNGGFCTDPFLQKASVVQQVKKRKALGSQRQAVDLVGNTMLHVSAALGVLDSVKALIEDHGVLPDVENSNGETPLYKACQAGHADVVYFLLRKGAKASVKTQGHSITPLHWLFTFPKEHIANVATQLVNLGGADVNAVMRSSIDESPNSFPDKVPIAHFPFELPLGSPLHWASFARNKPAIDILVDLGANINAVYHNMDFSTTPLALAVWFTEPEIVLHLLSKGADGTVKDSSGRNLLHMLSHHLPDRHGHLDHYWNYWIRHGNWDSHVGKMSVLVNALVNAGVDLEAVPHNDPAKSTPILLAGYVGRIWDGGAICAMVAAGADVESPRSRTGETVLHCWCSAVGPRVPYPVSYLHVFEQIASRAISNINVHNKWAKYTPLHTLAIADRSGDEFEAACDILWSQAGETPIDIDAVDNRGMTAFVGALQSTDIDASRRAMYLLHRGASLTKLVDEIKNVFHYISANQSLSDSQCYNLIIQILAHLEGFPPLVDHEKLVLKYRPIYQSHFQPFSSEQRQRSTLLAIWIAATSGRLLTTRLLLDLTELPAVLLNEPTAVHIRFFWSRSSTDPPETLLDRVLSVAENERRRHIESLRLFKVGAARERAITQNLAFGPSDLSFPEHAAETLNNLPLILRMLRHEYGAKRAIETIPEKADDEKQKKLRTDIMNHQFYYVNGGAWDLIVLYQCGYTLENQPQRAEWRILYELNNTYCDDFDKKTLRELKDKYFDVDDEGEWRPHIKLLKTAVPLEKNPDTEVFTRVQDRLLPSIISMFKELGRVDEEGRIWIEASDETSVRTEAKCEVEILDGGKVGRTCKIKK